MRAVLLLSWFVPFAAAAFEYECRNKPAPFTKGKTEIKTVPQLHFVTSFEECPQHGGVCNGWNHVIADASRICEHDTVNVNQICDVMESDVPGFPNLEVNCLGLFGLIFDIDANGEGTAVCTDGSVEVRRISLGQCRKL